MMFFPRRRLCASAKTSAASTSSSFLAERSKAAPLSRARSLRRAAAASAVEAADTGAPPPPARAFARASASVFGGGCTSTAGGTSTKIGGEVAAEAEEADSSSPFSPPPPCFFLPPSLELEGEEEETLLEANDGPGPCVAAFEASEGGGSIACSGGGGTREAAAAFLQEEGVSEGEEEAEEVEVDFAVLASSLLRANARNDAKGAFGTPRSRRRAAKTSPRSIERILARLLLLLGAGARIESCYLRSGGHRKDWSKLRTVRGDKVIDDPKPSSKSKVFSSSFASNRIRSMALRTCLLAASRSLPRAASARPAATTTVRAMASAAQKDVPPPTNTPSKVR